MSLAVLSPCYSAEQGQGMVATAKRVGLSPVLYDQGVLCDGHGGNIQYYHLLPILEQRQETHVLVTDCSDVAFLTGEDEILDKFKAFNSGFLVSAEADGCTGLTKTKVKLHEMALAENCYHPQINVGLWVGEREYALHVLKECRRLWVDRPEDPNYSYDSHWQWLSMMKAWGGGPEFDIDWHCVLFQSMNKAGGLEWDGKRLVNTLTGTRPVALHYNGDKTRVAYHETVSRLMEV